MRRFKHPIHGWHHPQSGSEEAAMRLNGWVEDVAEKAVEEVKEIPEEVIEKYEDEVALARQKLQELGIEFHHRMGLAKLKALLPES